MSDPVGVRDHLPPSWLYAAHSRAVEFGFGQDLARLSDEKWAILCQAVELTVAEKGAPPAGWRDTLARQAGRTPPEEKQRDDTDARLAERGEVFAIDDDA